MTARALAPAVQDREATAQAGDPGTGARRPSRIDGPPNLLNANRLPPRPLARSLRGIRWVKRLERLEQCDLHTASVSWIEAGMTARALVAVRFGLLARGIARLFQRVWSRIVWSAFEGRERVRRGVAALRRMKNLNNQCLHVETLIACKIQAGGRSSGTSP
jgi:hypothetical protein